MHASLGWEESRSAKRTGAQPKELQKPETLQTDPFADIHILKLEAR